MKIQNLAIAIFIILSNTHLLAAQTEVVTLPSESSSSTRFINPANWPIQPAQPLDEKVENRVRAILGQMTIEEKVGQVIQADISAVTPEDVKKYNLGSVLNGGNSAPGGDPRAAAKDWLDLVDQFWEASTDRSDGGLGIPILWGTDAVHGHNNIVGATIFPHNIGLGAANDPALMTKIAAVTAREVSVTGMDWTFAPTLAVVQDDRWGRTYESYSESPDIVEAYAANFVEGLQGKWGSKDYLVAKGKVLGTAKHFVGDGGTNTGKDQGDTVCTEAELRDIHAAGYPAAIQSGVQIIMASFNSYHGKKLHGYESLLTGVLRERMGFNGFVVGDWNGHGQVAGCTPTDGASCFNAGLDMFMAPDTWKALYETTLKQVKSGKISQQRLNQAVTRILRVKVQSGLLDRDRPSSRPLAGKFDLLGCDEHLAIARQAVRESLVLLKNNNSVLPIKSNTRVLVAGPSADDMGVQCGGWTYSWQGTGNEKKHFPNGETIYQGLKSAVENGGGTCSLSTDGGYTEKPDVAIVVFGEKPYAEFSGDQPNLDFPSQRGLELLEQYRAEGIPTVGLFVAGRPLWVNPEINASDAFVVAWLPGIAGGGVADVLVTGPNDKPKFDFRGRLSFSWPRSPYQKVQNVGSGHYSPLFAFGFGLSYQTTTRTASLPVEFAPPVNPREPFLFESGEMVSPGMMVLRDAGGETVVGVAATVSPQAALSIKRVDGFAQEDTLEVTWASAGSVMIRSSGLQLQQEDLANSALRIVYRLSPGSDDTATITANSDQLSSPINLADLKSKEMDNGWRSVDLKLSDVAVVDEDAGTSTAAFAISSPGGAKLQLNSMQVIEKKE